MKTEERDKNQELSILLERFVCFVCMFCLESVIPNIVKKKFGG